MVCCSCPGKATEGTISVVSFIVFFRIINYQNYPWILLLTLICCEPVMLFDGLQEWRPVCKNSHSNNSNKFIGDLA